MENIYEQTESARNSIVEIPADLPEKSGKTLISWLGSIWRSNHKGDDMIRGLQSARGIIVAQMYLDALETHLLQDRNLAPVFHKELWHPIVIRLSQRDKSNENNVELGGEDKKIGPQPEGSEYGEGTEFVVGEMAEYEKFVAYPIDADIVGGAVSIVDNIVNPTVFMERGAGKDFEIRNKSIIFPKENDPLGDLSPFEKYDVPSYDSDDPEDHDVEALVWASDVLIDRDYVSSHISYAIGIDAPSSDVVKRIVNSSWSAITSGLTPELVRTMMASMLNVPVIQGDRETVVGISYDDDATVVKTDLGTYKVYPRARLRSCVEVGAVMRRGELLDESIRVYPFINMVDTSDGNPFGFSVPLRQDIPSVSIPGDMMFAKTEHGIYSMWGNTTVKRNRDGKLYFDIGGSERDVSEFWNYVWDSADSSGVDLESIIGEEGSEISPADFFIKNLVGANTMFVVIDRSQVDDPSMMRNPMFFDMLTSVVPSAMRMFLVEHGIVDEDEKDLGEDADDEGVISAALPAAVDSVSCDDQPGPSFGGPSFGERVSMRFFRQSPNKILARKEEE